MAQSVQNSLITGAGAFCDHVMHNSTKGEASSRLDARVVRSREALISAFLALLTECSFENITVQKIAKKAGVHRTTFFRQFSTKNELLNYVAAEEITRLSAMVVPLFDNVSAQSSVHALCSYIDQHRLLWTALFTGGAAGTLRAEWLRVSREVASARALAETLIPKSLAVNCSVAVIFESMAWWLSLPAEDVSVDRMALSLHQMLHALALSSDQRLETRP